MYLAAEPLLIQIFLFHTEEATDSKIYSAISFIIFSYIYVNKKVNYMNERSLVVCLNSCQNEFQLGAKFSEAGISAESSSVA